MDDAGVETAKARSTQSAAKVFSGSNGNITLSWTAVPGAVSYKVYRTTVSNSYTTPAYLGTTTSTSYTDSAASTSAGAPNSYTFQGFSNALNSDGDSWIKTGGLVVRDHVDAGSFKVAGTSGVDGTFQLADGRWVTVTKGIITSIEESA